MAVYATVFEILTLKARKSLNFHTPPFFEAPVRGEPLEFGDEIWRQKLESLGNGVARNFSQGVRNVQVSTVRYTLMTRLGRGFRPGLSGPPVRAVVRRRPGTGRYRRVQAVMSPTDRRPSGSPTLPRQGVVDAAKLTGLQRAVLTIWREN